MQIPKKVKKILESLNKANFDAYLVGGCVRDLLRGEKPKDWDITTNAKPDEITRIFPDSFYDNAFGTVGVKIAPLSLPRRGAGGGVEIVQVTTYRIEDKYTDKRHPDSIKFADKLEDDLKRRDFTINAMAIAPLSLPRPASLSRRRGERGAEGEVVDLFNGREDLKSKLIRAVGEPKDRFYEDALRMMRAVRLATELGLSNGWRIEEKTFQAIKDNAHWIVEIARERVRDELIRIIEAKNAYFGVLMLHDCGLLRYIIPELEAGVGVTQNKHHIYTCLLYTSPSPRD